MSKGSPSCDFNPGTRYIPTRPTADTRPCPEVTQVAAEREKDTVLVLRTIRAICTRFLVGCHGGRSTSQCPACGVDCQVVSTYHSITPTQTVTFFVLCNRSARVRMRACVHRDETFAESVDMRKRRYVLLMFSSDMF